MSTPEALRVYCEQLAGNYTRTANKIDLEKPLPISIIADLAVSASTAKDLLLICGEVIREHNIKARKKEGGH